MNLKPTISRTILGIAIATVVHSAGVAEIQGEQMLSALKSGGYVIYLRHAITDTTKSDRDPVTFGDCSTQRPLSDPGRNLARSIGQTIKTKGIRIDQVLASPYCRAEETAALAFPGAKMKPLPMLAYSLAMPKEQAVKAAAELKSALAATPATGTNTVIVGHTSNLKEAAGIWPKKEGGAVVFRPDGNGGFALVGTIDPDVFQRAGS
jgi:phosphohistidine phosphatase SixA